MPTGKRGAVVGPLPTSGGAQFSLFDRRPMELDGFRLLARRVEAVGEITLTQWAAAFEVAYALEESAPYWIGDLWNLAEGRPDWQERIPQVLADLGLDVKVKTIYNHGRIAKKVKQPARDVAPTLSHAAVVASLSDDEQVEILTEAADKEWSVRETTSAVNARKRAVLLTGHAPSMHTVDVTVRLSSEGATAYGAEQAAWATVKAAIGDVGHVIAAHARPK